MKLLKRIYVKDSERVLLFRRENLEQVLMPGEYRFWDLKSELSERRYEATTAEFKHERGRFLATEYRDLISPMIESVQVSENAVGLLYEDGQLEDVLPPGSFYQYWKAPVETEIRMLDISEAFEVAPDLLHLLARKKDSYVALVGSEYVTYAEIPDGHAGLLYVNGKLEKLLRPGNYGYWKFHRNVLVNKMDCRLSSVEVSGQEILTRDRVSLRINLSASYQVVDPLRIVTQVSSVKDLLYRELQLALRTAVGTRTLDELLLDKTVLNEVIEEAVKAAAPAFGLEVRDIGVKDIILPGEMKAILNRVVEAQKAAEANQIRRREETQATRSLHNTAKVMEGSPVLMRLKELEVLEKVTERIDKITVYGGLESVLKDLVKIPAAINDGNAGS